MMAINFWILEHLIEVKFGMFLIKYTTKYDSYFAWRKIACMELYVTAWASWHLGEVLHHGLGSHGFL